MNQTNNEELTRHDLKNNALLERIAHLENDKAELRTDLTILNSQFEQAMNRIGELENEVASSANSAEVSDSTDSD